VYGFGVLCPRCRRLPFLLLSRLPLCLPLPSSLLLPTLLSSSSRAFPYYLFLVGLSVPAHNLCYELRFHAESFGGLYESYERKYCLWVG